MIPLKRINEANEIARACIGFSPVTGQFYGPGLHLDGGMSNIRG